MGSFSDVREQLREESLRLARLSFDRADAGIAANVVDAAIDEIDRLQEAKRRALKDSDRLAKENNALRQQLAALDAAKEDAAVAFAEIERLRLATDEGSLAQRANRIWEIACQMQGRPIAGAKIFRG